MFSPPGGLFPRCASDQGKASTCGQRAAIGIISMHLPLARFQSNMSLHVFRSLHFLIHVRMLRSCTFCVLCVPSFLFRLRLLPFVGSRLSGLVLAFAVVVVCRGNFSTRLSTIMDRPGRRRADD